MLPNTDVLNNAKVYNRPLSVTSLWVGGVKVIDENGQKVSTQSATRFFNAGHPVSASGFAVAADGTFFLDQNVAAATMVIPISGLKEGDVITAFRVVGAIGATSGNATVVDADLRKVTKGAGAVTDASVGAITQVSSVADAALDAEKTGLEETVSDDFQYYVLITSTTANNAANDLAVVGIEVDLTEV